MRRRSDDELVGDIIAYFIDNKRERFISLTDFCKQLGINSATAKKWLELLWIIKATCPDFDFDEKKRLINFPAVSQYSRMVIAYNNHDTPVTK